MYFPARGKSNQGLSQTGKDQQTLAEDLGRGRQNAWTEWACLGPCQGGRSGQLGREEQLLL